MDLPFSKPTAPPLAKMPSLPRMHTRADGQTTPEDAALFAKAKELEAGFLAEMLGHTGLDRAPDSFGGGIGEEQFSSFLRAEQAKAMVEKGGVGLAEHIFHALKERASDASHSDSH